jgi:hypothetical protein
VSYPPPPIVFISFRMNTHFNPTGKILGDLGIMSVNTFLFLS